VTNLKDSTKEQLTQGHALTKEKGYIPWLLTKITTTRKQKWRKGIGEADRKMGSEGTKREKLYYKRGEIEQRNDQE